MTSSQHHARFNPPTSCRLPCRPTLPAGDYDFSRDAAGWYRTHHEISRFLAAVLDCPPPAKCDSINIAGMLELHRTQVGRYSRYR